MVLAASNADHTQVELLDPPPGSKPGDRVVFDGHPGEPDAQLNPKHKIWEQIQPDFITTDDCTAVWKGIPFKTSGGIVKVKSIAKGTIK
jgi:rubredoxin